MPTHYDAEVIIIGAGPVGLVAAAQLNSRGVSSIVVEKRPYLEPPSVKSNHVSARTMERFRMLGLAHKVRNSGLPADYPNDISFRTRMTGREFARIPIPARKDRYSSTRGPDTAWSTPEPAHRINQTFLEPVLLQHVAGLENVNLLNETSFLDFEQTESGVTVRVIHGTTEQRLSARYLIGADGSRSSVRKQIGARLTGDPVIQHVQSTCIRAPGLYDRMEGERAWGYYNFNPQRNGHVYAIDGDEVFLVHNHLSAAEFEDGSVDRNASITAIIGIGTDFNYEVLSTEDWVARRLVADRFRDKRVFLVGDAAHLWVPYAGYGMNAGIADALNLCWLIAADIEGWADEGILDAYEAERLPITAQVSKFAMIHAQKVIESRSATPATIEDDTPEGMQARERFGREVYELNVNQFAAAGLNFGYVYDESPIIIYDEELPPQYSMGTYTPSTVPGCRVPHFWINPSTSLYDELGPVYTLLVGDDSVDVAPLMEAATTMGIPLKLLAAPAMTEVFGYRHKLVICRQDQHVAWRGDAVPANPSTLMATLRGSARAAS